MFISTVAIFGFVIAVLISYIFSALLITNQSVEIKRLADKCDRRNHCIDCLEEENELYFRIIKKKNNEIDDLQEKLAFAGKNYIEMRNSLCEKINAKTNKATRKTKTR